MQRTRCMTSSLASRIAGAALLSFAVGCGPEPDVVIADPPGEGAGSAGAAATAEHATDSILVRFRSTEATERRRGSLTAIAGTIDDPDGNGIDDRFALVSDGQLALVRLDGDIDVQDAIARLRRDPAVLYAEPDYIVHATQTPDDPRFGELWGLHNTGQTGGTPDADIDAVEAWDISVGSADVVVGVVDTGVDHGHKDLAGNIFVNPAEIPDNGIDDDGNGVIDDVHGFNAIDGSGDAFDDNGHGSHVSGTLGAVGNNGVGVTGVSWEVRIMALKFLSASGSGTLADAIEAINYAVAQKNAGFNLRVLSNSWGGGGFSQALLDAITAAGAADIMFVATAGGSASDNDVTPSFPASYDAANIVAVAATDHDDELASFSNFGATSVDLGAPGVGILSTTPGNTYSVFSGTSMATPHVSGAAALVLSANPGLDTAAVKSILLHSGDPVPSLDGITVSGRRLNAAAALQQAALYE